MTTPPTPWLIAYDIADPKRLRRVERAVSAVGVRVHNSLFLCDLDEEELLDLQRRLARLIDIRADAVQYTPWCAKDQAASRHLGTSASPVAAAAWIV
ncbi:MAG: CRISPR-associated endonuclease Cas2 [Gammaproteobacteria bacterium]|nr:CRISPR-associated endonuclease Cas2 [Gammaproteobacteria bacterium]MBU1654094.1 CRISPR-associated endonuclease Cas2 [Gammaproteobacteria bacterium]MBU1961375.1 CRISPR-associated endonuclease Cas2 [Gammaproteobacteria bacterium]